MLSPLNREKRPIVMNSSTGIRVPPRATRESTCVDLTSACEGDGCAPASVVGRGGDGPPSRPRRYLRAARLRLISHDVGGVTSRDVKLAETISDLALAAGATPHPER